MYKQLNLFDLYQMEDLPDITNISRKHLNIGDYVGRLVLGEVEKGRIEKVEGNDRYLFYRTDRGCFDMNSRTDFGQLEKEAAEIRKRYKTIEIDHFDKFFAVAYPPRICDGKILYAMVGIFQDMLFWKKECTYQFLEPVKNLKKEYEKKLHDITHKEFGDKKELEYTVLDQPIPTKRLYWSKKGFYADPNYVLYNG